MTFRVTVTFSFKSQRLYCIKLFSQTHHGSACTRIISAKRQQYNLTYWNDLTLAISVNTRRVYSAATPGDWNVPTTSCCCKCSTWRIYVDWGVSDWWLDSPTFKGLSLKKWAWSLLKARASFLYYCLHEKVWWSVSWQFNVNHSQSLLLSHVHSNYQL